MQVRSKVYSQGKLYLTGKDLIDIFKNVEFFSKDIAEEIDYQIIDPDAAIARDISMDAVFGHQKVECGVIDGDPEVFINVYPDKNGKILVSLSAEVPLLPLDVMEDEGISRDQYEDMMDDSLDEVFRKMVMPAVARLKKNLRRGDEWPGFTVENCYVSAAKDYTMDVDKAVFDINIELHFN